MSRDLTVATACLALLGCGTGDRPQHDAGVDAEPPPCTDPDGDGFGEGPGCLGADCREDDPTLQECVCDADGVGTGCGCALDAPPLPCFDGEPEQVGVGVCMPGLRVCRDGRWSVCEGEVVPTPEECDYEDDDCDGVVDDGVLSPCGDCNGDCNVLVVGQGGEPFALDDPNVADRGDGAIGLVDGAHEGTVLVHAEGDDFCIDWAVFAVDADVPAGASLRIERLSPLDGSWELVAELPAEPLPVWFAGWERAVDLRLMLSAADDGQSPLIRSMTLRYVHGLCG